MVKRLRWPALVACFVLLASALSTAQGDEASVGVADHGQLGSYLVDGQGRTLYRFLEDTPGRSTCGGDCSPPWKPAHFEDLMVSSELVPSRFGEIAREDGTLQSTYLGWPLYRFAEDEQPGDVQGQGWHNAWFVIPPSGLDPLVAEWMLVELVDVLTNTTFRIADFYGKPVLIESFAVWCSVCLRQQKEMAKLVEREGDAIVHVSLDTDPNEAASAVRGHAEKHGFDWLFAVSPISLTETLIDQFGLAVVNAPRAPVILVEPDGTARLLRNGVKSANALLEDIEGGTE